MGGNFFLFDSNRTNLLDLNPIKILRISQGQTEAFVGWCHSLGGSGQERVIPLNFIAARASIMLVVVYLNEIFSFLDLPVLKTWRDSILNPPQATKWVP